MSVKNAKKKNICEGCGNSKSEELHLVRWEESATSDLKTLEAYLCPDCEIDIITNGIKDLTGDQNPIRYCTACMRFIQVYSYEGKENFNKSISFCKKCLTIKEMRVKISKNL